MDQCLQKKHDREIVGMTKDRRCLACAHERKIKWRENPETLRRLADYLEK